MHYTLRVDLKRVILYAAVLLAVTAVWLTGRFLSTAAAGNPATAARPGQPGPLPDFAAQPANPSAVSSMLSYFFIPGPEFTPDGNVAYTRQVTGCVNQMPPDISFSAGVHLPNGSVVESITLYSYDTIASASSSGTAMFIFNNSKDLAAYTVSAQSPLNTSGYAQTTSTQVNPTTIDNQNYNYYVAWRKSGAPDSTYLSLCGVRIAYHAPLGAIYLPAIVK